MELAELALMKAVFSDPDKKAVLDEIEARIKAAQEAERRALDAAMKHQSVLEEAKDRQRRAAGMLADVAAREKVLQDSTEGLANANRAMNEEKTRWEKIRQTVDADQKKWTDELAAREAKVEMREQVADRREGSIKECAAQQDETDRRHQAAADHAARFLTAINARPA